MGDDVSLNKNSFMRNKLTRRADLKVTYSLSDH